MIDHHRSSVQKLHHTSTPSKYEDYPEGVLLNVDHQLEKENVISSANNKSDEETPIQSQKQRGGYVWRISSGLVSSTAGVLSGAVGLGVGGVKWVASKGYSAGGVVVDTTKNIVGKVPVSALKKKDKKE